jgi:hypothetical protein
MTLVIGTEIDPTALVSQVRKAIAGLDPELPVDSIKTMEELTADSLVRRRWPVRGHGCAPSTMRHLTM